MIMPALQGDSRPDESAATSASPAGPAASSWRSAVARLRQHAGFRRLLSNSGWMMGEQLFRLVTGLVVGVWMARSLGPVEFGELSYALAFSAVFGIVGTLGLNRILVRELVSAGSDTGAVGRLVSTTFAMRLAAALALYLLCLAMAWATHGGGTALVAIIAAGFFFSASDCIELYFQSRVQGRTTARVRMVSFLAVTAFRVGLLLAGAGPVAFATAALIEFAAAALVLQLALRRSGGVRLLGTAPDWRLGARLLSESWPEIIAGFSGLLFIRLDQIMLQHLAGPSAVGNFAVAARLSEAWYFVPIAIIASTFPSIVACRETDRRVYLKRIQLLMAGLCAISYVAAALATLLAGPAIRLMFGTQYEQAAAILSIHIWSGLFVSLGLASGSWIMAERRVRLNLYRNLAGLAANIALNLALIPRFGALGAACATLASLVIAYMLFDLFVPSMHEIRRGKLRALLIVPALRNP
jgi:PST family polysaccharide transporter